MIIFLMQQFRGSTISTLFGTNFSIASHKVLEPEKIFFKKRQHGPSIDNKYFFS